MTSYERDWREINCQNPTTNPSTERETLDEILNTTDIDIPAVFPDAPPEKTTSIPPVYTDSGATQTAKMEDFTLSKTPVFMQGGSSLEWNKGREPENLVAHTILKIEEALSEKVPGIAPNPNSRELDPIEQVIEEFREKFYQKDQGSFVLLQDEVMDLEQFLREKLEEAEGKGFAKAASMHRELDDFQRGRTQRTQEIIHLVEGMRLLYPKESKYIEADQYNAALDSLLERLKN